jgi:hypothetical protein
MMSRSPFTRMAFSLIVLLASSTVNADGFGNKAKAPLLNPSKIEAARDKAVRAYDIQTEFPGASDAEKAVARAAPTQIDEPIKPDDQKPSEWWARIGRILGPVFQVLGWGILTAIVLGILYYCATVSGAFRFRRSKEDDASHDLMAPLDIDANRARNWLAEAEEMAARGHYGEAVHFLLFSSFDDLRRRLRTALRPAWTSRDILRDVPLRTTANNALTILVDTVEISEFAGHSIGHREFTRCKESYAQFLAEVAG